MVIWQTQSVNQILINLYMCFTPLLITYRLIQNTWCKYRYTLINTLILTVFPRRGNSIYNLKMMVLSEAIFLYRQLRPLGQNTVSFNKTWIKFVTKGNKGVVTISPRIAFSRFRRKYVRFVIEGHHKIELQPTFWLFALAEDCNLNVDKIVKGMYSSYS